MSRRLTTAQFIEKAKAVHGDRYDYSLVEYVNAKEKVRIICAEHGEFLQDPFSHSKGIGCPACGRVKTTSAVTGSAEDFMLRAAEIHNNFYSYNQVIYKNARKKVEITCPIHGVFMQTPDNHLSGHGCAACRADDNSIRNSDNTDEFIKKAVEIHGDKYGYEHVRYRASNTKVKIKCRVHGIFYQVPNSHLRGSGCPRCGIKISRGEEAIKNHLDKHFCVEQGNRELLRGKEIDIFIPEKNIGIEYNGAIWHSEKYHKDPKRHMLEKQESAANIGVRLIHIYDTDPTEVVKKTLNFLLGITDRRIHARKCTAKEEAMTEEVSSFLRDNHLQGTVSGCRVFTLRLQSELIAVMCFSQTTSRRGNKDTGLWELRRFSCLARIPGAASKLLAAFVRSTPQCHTILSFSDNRWFTGNMYKALGFRLDAELPPDYKYVSNGPNRGIQPKNKFRRENLAKMEGFNFKSEESEHQNCLRNGWYRIYDCGKRRWILELK